MVSYEKSKFLGFGGSIVVRLKFKEIDRKSPLGIEPMAPYVYKIGR